MSHSHNAADRVADRSITTDDIKTALAQATPIKGRPRPGSGPRHGPVKPDSDSIRAHKDRARARNECMPVPISQLGPSRPPTWIWSGIIAAGYITLLTALWKSGKSTLLAHLLRDFRRGTGLVDTLVPLKTLVISEEAPEIWCGRRDDLDLTDDVHIHCRPFAGRPSWTGWGTFIESIRALVRKLGFGLVVIDTLSSMWPVGDENDAAQVTDALLPLHSIAESGVAIVLMHHPRKSGGEEGQASRGSGALPGFVDCIAEMRRFIPSDIHNPRRLVTCLSRLGNGPVEIVLELSEDGYIKIGDRSAMKAADRATMIASILPSEGAGTTLAELQEVWPNGPAPGGRSLAEDLAPGTKIGKWECRGSGRKGDPYRYRKPPKCDSRTDNVLIARNESKPRGQGEARP
jgi:hypothetical protein